jgi:hypothetical protein
MDTTAFQQRLKDLSEHIEKDLELLKEFEDALRYEDDPRRKAKYRIETARLKESSLSYRQEHLSLKEYLETKPQQQDAQEIELKLKQIDGKLHLLLDSQVGVYQRLDNLTNFQLVLLARYDEVEQATIAPAISQLNQQQSILTKDLLDALECKRIPQEDIQKILSLVSTHVSFLSEEQAKVAQIIESPEVSAEHKLKVTIPIIPFVLDYEGELSLGASFNVKDVLEKVKAKLRLRNS